MTEHGDVLHYAGSRLHIWLVRRSDGAVPAEEFLSACDKSVRAKFRAIFEYLGDEGKIANKQRMEVMQGSGGVWEFKVHEGKGWRMWGKYGPNGMYVTHGGAKPKRRAVNAQAALATEIFDEGDRHA